MAPETRRLLKLTLEPGDDTNGLMDMLLSKKRASDRKTWLETKGNLADVAASGLSLQAPGVPLEGPGTASNPSGLEPQV